MIGAILFLTGVLLIWMGWDSTRANALWQTIFNAAFKPLGM